MTVHYLAIALILLLMLAGYLFLSHSIQKRRIRRQRLLTALKARRNSFRDLVDGFPKGFLTQDLTNLLYRSLIDICEQLTRLESKEPGHAEQLAFYTSQLSAQQNSENQAKVRLDNPEQVREARHLLQELYKFVQQQSQLKLINKIQTEAYTDQIKRLVLQMGVDNHLFNARQAQQIGKLRLAIHHYGLARKLLVNENGSHGFDKQIAQLDSVIAKLQEKAQSQTAKTATPETPAEHQPAPAPISTTSEPATSKEWDRFAEETDGWKKKQLYD